MSAEKFDLKNIGKEIVSDLEKKGLFIGTYHKYPAIPVPSLAVEFLLGYDGYPLSVLTQIVGKKSSFKTSLSIEIAKWHVEQNGGVFYIDTEGGSSALVQSILGDNVVCFSCSTLDKWMATVNYIFKKISEDFDEKNTHCPICIIVDSVTAVSSTSTIQKMDEEGILNLSYPTDTKQISQFFKKKSEMLNRYPFSFIGINHIKETISLTGGQEEYVPGGRQLQYVCNVQLRTTKVKKPELTSKDTVVSAVKIETDFNRLANEGRAILVPVIFKYLEEREVICHFDWYAATTKLLSRAEPYKRDVGDKWLKRIKQVIDVQERASGSKGILYYCKDLGITESSALDATEFGKLIESNQAIKEELRRALMIRRAVFYSQDKPYNELQLEGERNAG